MEGFAQYVLEIVFNYRYAGLFVLLSLGMIGLPVPDELLMTFSGFQTSVGRMNFLETFLIATVGSFLGMNLS
ncbi:MAG: DedA family protein [Desulfitobacteriaceae bacterium]